MREKVLDCNCVFASLSHSLHTLGTGGGSCGCPLLVYCLFHTIAKMPLCVFSWISKQIPEAGNTHFIFFHLSQFNSEQSVPQLMFPPSSLTVLEAFCFLIASHLVTENKERTFPVNMKTWKPGNSTLKIVHNAIVASFVRHCRRICYSTLDWQDHRVKQIVWRNYNVDALLRYNRRPFLR